MLNLPHSCEDNNNIRLAFACTTFQLDISVELNFTAYPHKLFVNDSFRLVNTGNNYIKKIYIYKQFNNNGISNLNSIIGPLISILTKDLNKRFSR